MAAELVTVFNNITALMAALPVQVQGVLDKGAEVGVAYAQSVTETDYPPASSPGAPPAKCSGDLYDSIEVVADHGPLEAIFHADGGHAMYLELGTGRMAARPFMHPAADVVVPAMDVELAKLLP